MLLQASRLKPREGDQEHSGDGDESRQGPLHDRTPLLYTALSGVSVGNRIVSRMRRCGSTSKKTNRIASKLLPTGKMPQISPSHGAGMASEGMVRAGGASSFD